MAYINGNEVFLAADITETQVIREQLVCLTGEGEPTTSTEGFVGSLYIDINNGDLYKCISTVDGVFVWVLQDGNGGSVEIVDNLESEDTDKALSANQGRELALQIQSHKTDMVLEITENTNAYNLYPAVKAVTDYVNDKTGDIETALDGIIAIQNNLIGGDA